MTQIGTLAVAFRVGDNSIRTKRTCAKRRIGECVATSDLFSNHSVFSAISSFRISLSTLVQSKSMSVNGSDHNSNRH